MGTHNEYVYNEHAHNEHVYKKHTYKDHTYKDHNRRLVLFLLVLFLLALCCRTYGLLSVFTRFGGTDTETERIQLQESIVVEAGRYLVRTDCVNADTNIQDDELDKKKLWFHLRPFILHLFYGDGLCDMVLYPIVLFSIIIHLFGQNLYILLCRMIRYIHMGSAGKYKGCFFSYSVLFAGTGR